MEQYIIWGMKNEMIRDRLVVVIYDNLLAEGHICVHGGLLPGAYMAGFRRAGHICAYSHYTKD